MDCGPSTKRGHFFEQLGDQGGRRTKLSILSYSRAICVSPLSLLLSDTSSPSTKASPSPPDPPSSSQSQTSFTVEDATQSVGRRSRQESVTAPLRTRGRDITSAVRGGGSDDDQWSLWKCLPVSLATSLQHIPALSLFPCSSP